MSMVALAPADDVSSRAREDVEHDLAQNVAVSVAKVHITFAPSAGRGYALEAASFELDGKELAMPSIEQLRAENGVEHVFDGELASGDHALNIRLLYAGDFGLFSYMTGYKFKLNQKVTFETRRGLEIGLDVTPALDKDQEWQKRLSIAVKRSEKMLAQIDSTMPEPMQRPKLASAEPALPPPPPVEPVVEAAAPRPETAAALAKAPRAPADLQPRQPEPPVVVAAAETTPAPTVVTEVELLKPAPEPQAMALAPLAASVTPADHDPWLLVAAIAAALVALGAIAAWRLRSPRSHRV
jgi:hypothetical protein